MDTKTLLKQLGGQAAIARECEISDSAVSQWVEDDAIPSARRKYLQLAHPGSHWAEYAKHLKGPGAEKSTNRREPESTPMVITPDRRARIAPRPKTSKPKRKGK